MIPNISERIHSAADFLADRLEGRNPVAGVVLGSGLGNYSEQIQDQIVIPYSEIPGFPVSTAVGHKGNLICGFVGGRCVLAMQGRFHFYEGYPMELVTICIRVMKLLGIQYLFVSNAAGACNPDYRMGDLVIIRDHICAMPNPLIGPNLDEFGPRFPDMTVPYDRELRARAHEIAEGLGFSLNEGVYYGSSGPTYETPAEVRFYRSVGADLLGMSTVPEVIVARHCGLRVFGVSVVTNCCNTDNVENNFNDADDVVLQAGKAAKKMEALFTEMISQL